MGDSLSAFCEPFFGVLCKNNAGIDGGSAVTRPIQKLRQSEIGCGQRRKLVGSRFRFLRATQLFSQLGQQ
jgi:hypothetical protein